MNNERGKDRVRDADVAVSTEGRETQMADRYTNRPHMDDSGDQGFRRQPDGEGDPLAELARLIGQTDPQSSFAKGQQGGGPRFQRSLATDFSAGSPSWLHTAQANREPGTIEDDHHEGDDTPVLSPMPSFLHQQHAHAQYQDPAPNARHPTAPHQGGSRYDDVLYGQQQQESYADQYQDEQSYQDEHYSEDDALANRPAFLEESESRRRSGGLLTVAVVIGLAVIGTAGAYAYRSYTGAPRAGEAPVIKADTSPSKVVPPIQSGDGSGKMIYDRIGSAGGPEKVISREEQPVEVSSPSTRVVFPPLNQGNSSTRSVAAASPLPSAQTASADSANSDEPRKIRTVPIRADQPSAGAQAKAAPPPTPVRTTPVRIEQPAPQQAGSGPMQLTPSASSSSVRSASAAVPPASASPSSNAAPASVTPSGGYLVQIASQKTEAEAQASYRTTQTKFSNLLGSMSPIIKRADLGDKGVFYRALVGPFQSSDEATRLCTNLKIAGGSCLIQRN